MHDDDQGWTRRGYVGAWHARHDRTASSRLCGVKRRQWVWLASWESHLAEVSVAGHMTTRSRDHLMTMLPGVGDVYFAWYELKWQRMAGTLR